MLLSVTFAVKLKVPAVFGVPLIAPVEGFRSKPPGNAPPPRDQVYDVVPPCAVSVTKYGPPTLPLGSDVVVIVGSDAMATRPILLPKLSVNHNAPSGPVVIPQGRPPDVGTEAEE